MNRNSPDGKNLSRRQLKAVRALLREPSIDKAASVAGVDQSSIDRWLKDPVFYNALIDAEWQLIDEAIRSGAADLSDSMKTMSEIMRDKTAAKGVRVRAAQGLADALTKLHGHRQLHKLQPQQQQQTGDDWIAAEDTGNDQAGDQTDQDSDDDSSTGTDSAP